jgi:hypothetical protein
VKPTIKFALLCGLLAALGATFADLSFAVPRVSRMGDVGALFSGVVFALPVFLGPYLASRRGWLATPVSLGRCLVAALPLPLLPIAFFVGMMGWGDMQEHWIRRVLHATHRELPNRLVAPLIMVGVIVSGAAFIGLLVWISLSVLTKRWSGRALLVLLTGCALLSGFFWTVLFAVNAHEALVNPVGLMLLFLAGFFFALAIEMNSTSRWMTFVFRASCVSALVVLVGGGAFLFAKSVPEKHFPALEGGPVWKFDIASTGCRPTWGGPDSSSASANEIAFASDEYLGMAFTTDIQSKGGNKFEYKTCIFTVEAKSAKKVAQISIDGERPVINGSPDGNFTVRVGGHWTAYTTELKQADKPQDEQKTEDGTAAKWHDFNSDSAGNLWYGEGNGKKLLLHYSCGGVLIHALGPERVLVTGCGQFWLYRADGTQLATESFLRENVNFAALSADHRRFAVAVYLWGVGDPSYLEEEKIIVYDAISGEAVAAVRSDPLPVTQSWTALSADGTLLAVGAQSTLRLFRLPPALK